MSSLVETSHVPSVIEQLAAENDHLSQSEFSVIITTTTDLFMA